MPLLFVFFFLYKNKEENLREKPSPGTLFWRLFFSSRGVKLHCHLSRDNFLEYNQDTQFIVFCSALDGKRQPLLI